MSICRWLTLSTNAEHWSAKHLGLANRICQAHKGFMQIRAACSISPASHALRAIHRMGHRLCTLTSTPWTGDRLMAPPMGGDAWPGARRKLNLLNRWNSPTLASCIAKRHPGHPLGPSPVATRVFSRKASCPQCPKKACNLASSSTVQGCLSHKHRCHVCSPMNSRGLLIADRGQRVRSWAGHRKQQEGAEAPAPKGFQACWRGSAAPGLGSSQRSGWKASGVCHRLASCCMAIRLQMMACPFGTL